LDKVIGHWVQKDLGNLEGALLGLLADWGPKGEVPLDLLLIKPVRWWEG